MSIAARGRTGATAVRLWTAGLIGLAIVAPFFLYPVFLMKALCMALFACAFNLLLGYVGLLSFGHAAFFGSASYITAHAVKVWGVPTELGILAGVAVAAALGLVFGYLAIRRSGIYFAMVTLAFAQMVFFFCVFLKSATPPFGLDLSNDQWLYFMCWAIAAILYVPAFLMLRSRTGRAWMAIR
ncbi:MAG: branched-chain amino acid ABC transporter permease, partial [Chloroflexi bacterium]